jgi:hypothetical protein
MNNFDDYFREDMEQTFAAHGISPYYLEYIYLILALTVLLYLALACGLRALYTWAFKVNEQISETKAAVESTRTLNKKLENVHQYLVQVNSVNEHARRND